MKEYQIQTNLVGEGTGNNKGEWRKVAGFTYLEAAKNSLSYLNEFIPVGDCRMVLR